MLVLVMGKNGFGASVLGGKLLVVAGGPGSTSSGEHGRPPLPARRRKNSNPSSTSSSRRSLDQIASATVLPPVVQVPQKGSHPSLLSVDPYS